MAWNPTRGRGGGGGGGGYMKLDIVFNYILRVIQF